MEDSFNFNLKELVNLKKILKFTNNISSILEFPIFLLDHNCELMDTTKHLSFEILDIHKKNNYIFTIEKNKSYIKLPVFYNKKLIAYIVSDTFSKLDTDYDKFLDGIQLLKDFLLQSVNIHMTNLELYEERKKSDLAKLKTLESQMNPHFIFNTLNSINRMAFFEDAPKTEEMLYTLSDFLRYNLKDFEEFPSLKKEIENIKRYLFIQEIRFGERLKYSINIDNKLLDYRIPSMMIQPLVENAIIHGIQPKAKGGIINIDIEKNEDNILVKIIDTGIGMDCKKIDSLLKDNSRDVGLGISNSNNRIKSYFGEEYGLDIISEMDNKTIVQIRIPPFKTLNPNTVL